MATFTIPAPVAGGSFSINVNTSALCHLGGNRFLTIFQQTNPHQVYARVVSYTGLTTAPATGDAYVIRQNTGGTTSYIRVLPFNNGASALVLYGTGTGTNVTLDAQWLSIDPDTDAITEGSVQSVALGYTPASGATSAFAIFKLSETRLRMVLATASDSYRLATPAVEINGAVTLGSLTPITGKNITWVSIPNTGNTMEWITSGSTQIAFRVIDGNGATVSDISMPANFGQTAIPNMLSVASTRRAVTCLNGTTIHTITDGVLYPAISTGGNLMNTVNLVHALDEHHVLLLYLPTTSPTARVIRILSDGIAEISPPTSLSGGLPIPMGTVTTNKSWYANASRFHEGLYSIDENTKLVWFTTQNQIGYTVLAAQ